MNMTFGTMKRIKYVRLFVFKGKEGSELQSGEPPIEKMRKKANYWLTSFYG